MVRQYLATGSAIAVAGILCVTSVMAQTGAIHGSPNTTSAGSASGAPGSASAAFLSRQVSDQLLASDFVDRSVYGPDGQSVGDINDLVIDKQGNIVAVVVGVGGFLGIGEKDVAIPFKSLQMMRSGNNEERIVVSVTRNDLTNAPAFVAASNSSTTGTGLGSSANPGGSSTTPPAR